MKQLNRLDEILDIIATNVVETQSELMNLLRNRGYDVTQATVSRDIKRLNLHKSHDEDNHYRYVADTRNTINSENALIKSCVVSIEYALNDVVIKCRAGAAQAVCSLIDDMDNEHVIGTVAGDDTILVIARSESEAQLYCKHFKELL